MADVGMKTSNPRGGVQPTVEQAYPATYGYDPIFQEKHGGAYLSPLGERQLSQYVQRAEGGATPFEDSLSRANLGKSKGLLSPTGTQDFSKGLGGPSYGGAINSRASRAFDRELGLTQSSLKYQSQVNDMQYQSKQLQIAQQLANERYQRTLQVYSDWLKAKQAKDQARSQFLGGIIGGLGSLFGTVAGLAKG